MPNDPVPLPFPFDRAPFTRRGALAAGIGAERLRRADLVVPTRGARLPDDLAADTIARIRAIALLLRPDQYLSHTTAASLWHCPLPWRHQRAADVHVTTIGDGPVMRRTGVVGHRVEGPRAHVSGLMTPRASTPGGAWYECRTLLSVKELVVLGDHLVGAAGLADRNELIALIRAGDRSVQRARDAVELIRVGSESAMESAIRVVVVQAGFPEPELNMDVHDEAGRFLGRVDMAWPALKIVVEYDGDHHRDQDTFRHDARRRNAFVVNGWAALHVTALDARKPDGFLVRLGELFRSRSAA